MILTVSFRREQLQQFSARDEQLAAQGAAGFEFATLDQPVNAEIIDAEHIGRFLDGI